MVRRRFAGEEKKKKGGGFGGIDWVRTKERICWVGI